MTLLELFLEYSTCPVCSDEIRPTLNIGVDPGGHTDYTLTEYKYPLIFKKYLEYNDTPLVFSVQNKIENESFQIYDTDMLENPAMLKLRSAILYSYCPRGHYHCQFWRSPTVALKVIAIYSSIKESTVIGKYQLVNKINGSEQGSTAIHIYNRRYREDGRILFFKTPIPRSSWPTKDEVAFEEKVNKLLLLK